MFFPPAPECQAVLNLFGKQVFTGNHPGWCFPRNPGFHSFPDKNTVRGKKTPNLKINSLHLSWSPELWLSKLWSGEDRVLPLIKYEALACLLSRRFLLSSPGAPLSLSLLEKWVLWPLFQGGPTHPWCSGTWEDSAGVRDACGGDPHAQTLGHAGQNV